MIAPLSPLAANGEQAVAAALDSWGITLGAARRRDRLVDDAALVTMRRALAAVHADPGLLDNAPAESALIVRQWHTVLANRPVSTEQLATVPTAESTASDSDREAAAWQMACAESDLLGHSQALTNFFARCAKNIMALLLGEITVQALLFADDTEAITGDIYQRNPASVYTNEAAATAVRQLVQAHDVPAILELGGGTGATTDYVLRDIADHAATYHFTDVGSWFARLALQRYAGRAGFSTAVVDMNTAIPSGPGDGWNTVVASNVLHNAHHVGDCLQAIRQQMAPGGALVMIETGIEHLALLISMRFMMASESFQDPLDPRVATGRMFLTGAEWHAAINRSQWRLTECFPEPGHPLSPYGQQVFVAYAT